jgi:carbamoyltransferase
LWNDGLIASVDKHNRAAALARAGQRVFEELLSQLCRNARELSRSTNLVLTGGCALNSSANGKLLARTGFDRLYVPSAPADDGNAIGAALLAYFEDHPSESPKAKHQSPYLGSRMSGETLERTARVSGFRRVERLEPRALCDAVAEQLAAGALVGWVQGRAEFGPRALGNRSILADPRQAAMKDRINDAVKFREEFRPFAPAILAEHAATYFEDYQEAPYMERTLRWRPEVRGQVSAAVHVDGTGRLQTVHADWNPLFHGLLSRFYEKTGVPVLINTSFNVMGKPIVHSVEDAIAVFATSALDLLVIEEYLFAKC